MCEEIKNNCALEERGTEGIPVLPGVSLQSARSCPCLPAQFSEPLLKPTVLLGKAERGGPDESVPGGSQEGIMILWLFSAKVRVSDFTYESGLAGGLASCTGN